MKRLAFVSTIAVACIFVIAAFFAGCEKEPDTNALSDVDKYFDSNIFPPVNDGNYPIPSPTQTDSLMISPNSAVASYVNQKITFTAQGGIPPYQWTVADPLFGSIAPLAFTPNGGAANYTVNVLAPNTVLLKDSAGHLVQASITVQGDESSGGEVVFAISPTTAGITFIGQKVTFGVQGGTPPYFWEVANTSYGTIAPVALSVQNSAAVYTAKTIAPNSVVAIDSAGKAIVASVQAPVSESFKIIPASTIFVSNTNNLNWFFGEQINMELVGGVPPYSEWNVSMPSLGHMTLGSSNLTKNTYIVDSFNILGVNTIWVRDSAGVFAQATVETKLQ